MSATGEPTITPYTGPDYTLVTFKPDLPRFGMAALDGDTVALLSKRVYDMAGACVFLPFVLTFGAVCGGSLRNPATLFRICPRSCAHPLITHAHNSYLATSPQSTHILDMITLPPQLYRCAGQGRARVAQRGGHPHHLVPRLRGPVPHRRGSEQVIFTV